MTKISEVIPNFYCDTLDYRGASYNCCSYLISLVIQNVCVSTMTQFHSRQVLGILMQTNVPAYCCLHIHQWNESKLKLAYNNTTLQSPLYQTHYCLLLGCVLSAEGDNQAALVQFETAMTLSQHRHLSSLAAHLAASEAVKLHLSVVQLTYLKHLVKVSFIKYYNSIYYVRVTQ